VMVAMSVVFVGCRGSFREIDFELQRVNVLVPFETSSYVRNISGVRVIGNGAVVISSHQGWVNLLNALGEGHGYNYEGNNYGFMPFEEYKERLGEIYSPEFFQSNRIILIGLIANSGAGRWRVDNVYANGRNAKVYLSDNGCHGGFMMFVDWTFVIAVDRSFNPRRISMETTTYKCGEGDFE